MNVYSVEHHALCNKSGDLICPAFIGQCASFCVHTSRKNRYCIGRRSFVRIIRRQNGYLFYGEK